MPDLDFAGHNTLYATHGLHAYAAKCPPQLVRYGLRYYSKPGETILDPMAGSGTTLVEARLQGRNAIGFDIDPLARLIAQVKATVLCDAEILAAFECIERGYLSDQTSLVRGIASPIVQRRAQAPEFDGRDYWFAPQVTTALALLRYHIRTLTAPEPVRDFFWVAFSSLILSRHSLANARDVVHSRHHHYVHPEPPDVWRRFSQRVTIMRRQMTEFGDRCAKVQLAQTQARLGDARQLPLQPESVDLVFTSPPYATALDYPRAHFLAVAWLSEVLGLSLDDYRAGAAEYIGSERGRVHRHFELDARLVPLPLAARTVAHLATQDARRGQLTQRYFTDMLAVMGEIHRVLKAGRHAVLVVCPSHIRRVHIPTHQILIEIGRAVGLRPKQQYVRTIDARRRVLPFMQSFGRRMSTEYVLVFQKR